MFSSLELRLGPGTNSVMRFQLQENQNLQNELQSEEGVPGPVVPGPVVPSLVIPGPVVQSLVVPGPVNSAEQDYEEVIRLLEEEIRDLKEQLIQNQQTDVGVRGSYLYSG